MNTNSWSYEHESFYMKIQSYNCFFFAERIDWTTSTWLEHPRCKLIGILCSGGIIL